MFTSGVLMCGLWTVSTLCYDVIVAESLLGSPRLVELQGNNVTMNCESDSQNVFLSWYNATCGLEIMLACPPSDIVYTGWELSQAFASRFSIIGHDIEEKVVRHLIISRVEVSDGGMYVCKKDAGEVVTHEKVDLTVLLSQPDCSCTVTSELDHTSVSLNCTVAYGGSDDAQLSFVDDVGRPGPAGRSEYSHDPPSNVPASRSLKSSTLSLSLNDSSAVNSVAATGVHCKALFVKSNKTFHGSCTCVMPTVPQIERVPTDGLNHSSDSTMHTELTSTLVHDDIETSQRPETEILVTENDELETRSTVHDALRNETVDDPVALGIVDKGSRGLQDSAVHEVDLY